MTILTSNLIIVPSLLASMTINPISGPVERVPIKVGEHENAVRVLSEPVSAPSRVEVSFKRPSLSSTPAPEPVMTDPVATTAASEEQEVIEGEDVVVEEPATSTSSINAVSPIIPEEEMPKPAPAEKAPVPAASGDVIQLALSMKGVPYVWGGTSTSGWDCSGFVQYVFAQKGISLPRLAADQAASGTIVSDPQPGDLVSQNNGNHIGIYLGNGMMISALNPNEGTVVHPTSYMPVDFYSRL